MKAFKNVECIKLKTLRLSHTSEKLQYKNAWSPVPVLPFCVCTCIHSVNCMTKSYVNGNTLSRKCALIRYEVVVIVMLIEKIAINARKTIGMTYSNN